MALCSYGKHTHVAVFFPGAGCAAELQRQAVACHRCRRCQEVQGTDMCVDVCIDVGVDMCADMRIEMRIDMCLDRRADTWYRHVIVVWAACNSGVGCL